MNGGTGRPSPNSKMPPLQGGPKNTPPLGATKGATPKSGSKYGGTSRGTEGSRKGR